MNIFHKIQIADLGEMERQEQQNIALRRALYNGNKAIDLENYHTYEEVKIHFLPRKWCMTYYVFCTGDGLFGWSS